MSTLILMRHAKAVGHGDAPSDKERALVQRGRDDAASAGAALRAARFPIATALVSSARRTAETYHHVAPLLDKCEPRFLDELYETTPPRIWELAGGPLNSGAVLVIGHNPTIHECAVALLRQCRTLPSGGEELFGSMPTASWIAFALRGSALEAADPDFIDAWRPKKP
jgi:phosphohistidine phosphatase